jgi:hypothetical protein
VGGVPPDDNREDEVMHVLTAALSEDARTHRIGGGRRIDDRRVVHACIEYAEEIGQIPTILEL